ncbi:hypothetical protein WA158_006439 [Blastocystis sp. Blastoise]
MEEEIGSGYFFDFYPYLNSLDNKTSENDFPASYSHPDFEHGFVYGVDTMCVTDELDFDYMPDAKITNRLYNSIGTLKTITSKDSFYTWYHYKAGMNYVYSFNIKKYVSKKNEWTNYTFPSTIEDSFPRKFPLTPQEIYYGSRMYYTIAMSVELKECSNEYLLGFQSMGDVFIYMNKHLIYEYGGIKSDDDNYMHYIDMSNVYYSPCFLNIYLAHRQGPPIDIIIVTTMKENRENYEEAEMIYLFNETMTETQTKKSLLVNHVDYVTSNNKSMLVLNPDYKENTMAAILKRDIFVVNSLYIVNYKFYISAEIENTIYIVYTEHSSYSMPMINSRGEPVFSSSFFSYTSIKNINQNTVHLLSAVGYGDSPQRIVGQASYTMELALGGIVELYVFIRIWGNVDFFFKDMAAYPINITNTAIFTKKPDYRGKVALLSWSVKLVNNFIDEFSEFEYYNDGIYDVGDSTIGSLTIIDSLGVKWLYALPVLSIQVHDAPDDTSFQFTQEEDHYILSGRFYTTGTYTFDIYFKYTPFYHGTFKVVSSLIYLPHIQFLTKRDLKITAGERQFIEAEVYDIYNNRVYSSPSTIHFHYENVETGDSQNIPAVLDKTLTANAPFYVAGTYRASFIDDNYSSPLCFLTVVPSVPKHNFTQIYGQGTISGTVGIELDLRIQPRDIYGNIIDHDCGTFSMVISYMDVNTASTSEENTINQLNEYPTDSIYIFPWDSFENIYRSLYFPEYQGRMHIYIYYSPTPTPSISTQTLYDELIVTIYTNTFIDCLHTTFSFNYVSPLSIPAGVRVPLFLEYRDIHGNLVDPEAILFDSNADEKPRVFFHKNELHVYSNISPAGFLSFVYINTTLAGRDEILFQCHVNEDRMKDDTQFPLNVTTIDYKYNTITFSDLIYVRPSSIGKINNVTIEGRIAGEASKFLFRALDIYGNSVENSKDIHIKISHQSRLFNEYGEMVAINGNIYEYTFTPPFDGLYTKTYIHGPGRAGGIKNEWNTIIIDLFDFQGEPVHNDSLDTPFVIDYDTSVSSAIVSNKYQYINNKHIFMYKISMVSYIPLQLFVYFPRETKRYDLELFEVNIMNTVNTAGVRCKTDSSYSLPASDEPMSSHQITCTFDICLPVQFLTSSISVSPNITDMNSYSSDLTITHIESTNCYIRFIVYDKHVQTTSLYVYIYNQIISNRFTVNIEPSVFHELIVDIMSYGGPAGKVFTEEATSVDIYGNPIKINIDDYIIIIKHKNTNTPVEFKYRMITDSYRVKCLLYDIQPIYKDPLKKYVSYSSISNLYVDGHLSSYIFTQAFYIENSDIYIDINTITSTVYFNDNNGTVFIYLSLHPISPAHYLSINNFEQTPFIVHIYDNDQELVSVTHQEFSYALTNNIFSSAVIPEFNSSKIYTIKVTLYNQLLPSATTVFRYSNNNPSPATSIAFYSFDTLYAGISFSYTVYLMNNEHEYITQNTEIENPYEFSSTVTNSDGTQLTCNKLFYEKGVNITCLSFKSGTITIFTTIHNVIIQNGNKTAVIYSGQVNYLKTKISIYNHCKKDTCYLMTHTYVPHVKYIHFYLFDIYGNPLFYPPETTYIPPTYIGVTSISGSNRIWYYTYITMPGSQYIYILNYQSFPAINSYTMVISMNTTNIFSFNAKTLPGHDASTNSVISVTPIPDTFSEFTFKAILLDIAGIPFNYISYFYVTFSHGNYSFDHYIYNTLFENNHFEYNFSLNLVGTWVVTPKLVSVVDNTTVEKIFTPITVESHVTTLNLEATLYKRVIDVQTQNLVQFQFFSTMGESDTLNGDFTCFYLYRIDGDSYIYDYIYTKPQLCSIVNGILSLGSLPIYIEGRCMNEPELLCPYGQKLCFNGSCVDLTSECDCPPGYKDNICTYRSPLAPLYIPINIDKICVRKVKCPAGRTILCGDGRCVSDPSLCNTIITCPLNTLLCPNQYQCVFPANIHQCIRPLNINEEKVSDNSIIPTVISNRSLFNSSLLLPVANNTNVVKELFDFGSSCDVTQLEPQLCTGGYISRNCIQDCPSLPRCPPSMFLCPDYTCVGNYSYCTNSNCLYSTSACPFSAGCVDSPAEMYRNCPLFPSCPPETYLGLNFNCVPISRELTTVTCATDMILCPGGYCAFSRVSCGQFFVCPEGYVRCSDWSCAEHYYLCPKNTYCPNDLYQCPDGVCVISPDLCSPLYSCPLDAPVLCVNRMCVTDISECDAPETCPEETPIRCSNGACVSFISSCSPRIRCPKEYPTLCYDNTCQISPLFCRILSPCPAGMVRCADKSCVSSLSLCSTIPVGNNLDIHCYDNSYREYNFESFLYTHMKEESKINLNFYNNIILFNKTMDIESDNLLPSLYASIMMTQLASEDGYSKEKQGFMEACVDNYILKHINTCYCYYIPEVEWCDGVCVSKGTCAQSESDSWYECILFIMSRAIKYCKNQLQIYPCPFISSYYIGVNSIFINNNNIYLCPMGGLVTHPVLCGSPVICPSSRPFLFQGRYCLQQENNFISISEPREKCGFDQHQCPNGVCFDLDKSCPANVLCPNDTPYLCSDLTCVSDVDLCDTSTESNGYYVSTCNDETALYDSICIDDHYCRGNNGVLCPDDTCHYITSTNDIDLCYNSTKITSEFFYTSNSIIPASTDVTSVCTNPLYRHLCSSGSCVRTSLYCPIDIVMCPPPLALIRCFDGQTVCTVELLRDLVCPKTQEEIAFNNSCKSPWEVCTSWQCRLGHTCPLANGCSVDRPIRCRNGDCVTSQIECLSLSICGDGNYLCSDNVCVHDLHDCNRLPVVNSYCPLSKPVLCPDKTCQESEEGCPIIPLCSSSTPYRCNDGTCVLSLDLCSSGTTCGKNYTIRCHTGPDSGICVSSLQECRTSPLSSNTYSSACPPLLPVKCPRGTCVVSNSDCPNYIDDYILTKEQNGYYRCSTGEWKLLSEECDNPVNKCPGLSPYQCPDHTCVTNITKCSTSTLCNGYVCVSDGRCVTSADMCVNHVDCPPDFPFRCYDGSCVTTSPTLGIPLCRPYVTCPSETPYLCDDGTCVAHSITCLALVYPITQDIGDVIQTNGVLASKLFPAVIRVSPLSILEPSFKSSYTAVNNHVISLFSSNSTTASINDTIKTMQQSNNRDYSPFFFDCPFSRPLLCPNGLCVKFPRECDVHRNIKCPNSHPYLCYNNECVTSYFKCPKEECPAGMNSCWDGSCSKLSLLCPPLPLCPSPHPYRCPTGECVLLAEDCSSSMLPKPDNPYRFQ